MISAKKHLVRENLRLASFYIRDQKIAALLRKNVLTYASMSDRDELDRLKNLDKFVRRSFGINTDIDPSSQRYLELYKQIEVSRMKTQRLSSSSNKQQQQTVDLVKMAEVDFQKEWSILVSAHSDAKQIPIQALFPLKNQKDEIDKESVDKADEASRLLGDFFNQQIKETSKIDSQDIASTSSADKKQVRESLFDSDLWVRLQRKRKYRINKFF